MRVSLILHHDLVIRQPATYDLGYPYNPRTQRRTPAPFMATSFHQQLTVQLEEVDKYLAAMPNATSYKQAVQARRSELAIFQLARQHPTTWALYILGHSDDEIHRAALTLERVNTLA